MGASQSRKLERARQQAKERKNPTHPPHKEGERVVSTRGGMEKLLVPASVIGAGSRTGVVGGLVAPKGRR